jgi:5,10-methylenetetrahydrofolate reductase
MSKPTISFEFMPPREDPCDVKFWQTVDSLIATQPDFVSVTYGAGGHNRATAHAVTERLVRQAPVRPLAHLTCVGATRAETTEVIDSYLESGVRAFLALRGDQPLDNAAPDDALSSAVELIALLQARERTRCDGSASSALRAAVSPLIIAVATFPAGNPAAGTSPKQEAERLLVKQSAGANFAITQLFYDADVYLDFVELARRVGVTIPILAGILPATNPRRLRRIGELTGIEPNPAFISALESADDPVAVGINATGQLIKGLLDGGAPGVHIYTFNQASPTLAALTAADLLK